MTEDTKDILSDLTDILQIRGDYQRDAFLWNKMRATVNKLDADEAHSAYLCLKAATHFISTQIPTCQFCAKWRPRGPIHCNPEGTCLEVRGITNKSNTCKHFELKTT